MPAGLLLAGSCGPPAVDADADAAAPSEASLRAPLDADRPRRRCLAACMCNNVYQLGHTFDADAAEPPEALLRAPFDADKPCCCCLAACMLKI